MGKIKQGILGGFSGKVGNVIGTSWKGISVVKVMPQSVANPRTTAQVTQRNSLKEAVAFATQALSGFIKPCWDRFAQSMSGYNEFISKNIANFDNEGLIDPSMLVASKGKLTAPETFTLTGLANGNMTIAHTNAALGAYDSSTDVQMLLVYNERSGQVVGLTTAIQRTVLGPTTIASSKMEMKVGDVIHGWLVFRSADGTKVSAGTYDSFEVVA